MGKEYLPQVQVVSTVPSPAEVVLAEDFEHGFNWAITATTGGIYRRDPAATFQGPYGFYISTRTTTPASGDSVTIHRYVGLIRGKYLEFAVRFLASPDQSEGNQDFTIKIRKGTQYYQFGIRRLESTELLQYLDSEGNWTNITGITLTLLVDVWHYLRFVIDVTDMKYVCVDTGMERADLKNISPYTTTLAGTSLYAIVGVTITTTAAAATDIYLDQVFIRAVASP